MSNEAVFGEDSSQFASPVGTKLFSTSGHADLAGNVWEWILDAYDANAYSSGCNSTASCFVPGDPSATHVIRGGGYINDGSELRSAARGSMPPGLAPLIGFRCAR
jgi:formylglycine-generating enzyme required for sulfatase activity